MNERRASFVKMFDGSIDPWRLSTSFYEDRKRCLTLACLPDMRYANAYEPGCANGELTMALATRCDRLLASDGVEAAVLITRERVKAFPHVDVVQAWVPEDWPAGTFDLIILSELGYFLSSVELSNFVQRVKHSLSEKGVLLACHWRHPINGHPLDADSVHRLLNAELDMPLLVSHQEQDILIDVWANAALSVAQRDASFR